MFKRVFVFWDISKDPIALKDVLCWALNKPAARTLVASNRIFWQWLLFGYQNRLFSTVLFDMQKDKMVWRIFITLADGLCEEELVSIFHIDLFCQFFFVKLAKTYINCRTKKLSAIILNSHLFTTHFSEKQLRFFLAFTNIIFEFWKWWAIFIFLGNWKLAFENKIFSR